MAPLNGIHHLSTLTADMDRLIAFYEEVFDAHVTLDMEEEGLRHAFIELGPETVLHPFEMAGLDVPQDYIAPFERGRMDHVGLNASSEEAFYALRDRIVAAGAGPGTVTDMGVLLSVGYVDPDGVGHEIIYVRPGTRPADMLPRAEWAVA